EQRSECSVLFLPSSQAASMRPYRIRFARSQTALAAFVCAASLTFARPVWASGGGVAPRDSSQLVPGIARDRMIAPASLLAALAAVHRGIPSCSRQTKLACSACHYQFPQLTPFGRLFKLNGYTLTGLETIGQPADTTSETLKLAPIPPV